MKSVTRDGITFKLMKDEYVSIQMPNSDGKMIEDYFSIYWFKKDLENNNAKEVLLEFDNFSKKIDVYPGVIELFSTHYPELLI